MCVFKITDAVVVMDREQGAVEMLASKGIRLHSIISLFKLLNVLLAAERIDDQTAKSVRKFILGNNTFRYQGVMGVNGCSQLFYMTYLICNNSFSRKEENGSDVPATKKLCVEQNVELSYAERARLPSMLSPSYYSGME